MPLGINTDSITGSPVLSIVPDALLWLPVANPRASPEPVESLLPAAEESAVYAAAGSKTRIGGVEWR